MIVTETAKLGEILVRDFGVSSDVLERALIVQQDDESHRRIGAILEADFKIDGRIVAEAVANQRGLPFIDQIDIVDEVQREVRSISLTMLRALGVFPMAVSDDWVDIAVLDPDRSEGVELIEARFKRPARMHVVAPVAFRDRLNRIFQEAENSAEEVIHEMGEDLLLEGTDLSNAPLDLLEATDEDAPIIRLVNRVLFQAVRDRASDIHIEPMEDELVIRFRIDGVLYPILKPPKQLQASITSRVKIMAGMNIAEKRLPQDGRIRIRIAGKDVDIRASCLPTSHGERLVLRILDTSQVILNLEQLGVEQDILVKWSQLIQRPHGIILVTGPTGSGKTTTLYASLSEINSTDLNILTIEDPVEYQLKGIGQMNVNSKIDLTFASGLRTILRQDPDVILVGEIRDLETAEIAIQASLTGHLVFSTLHTNDAPGALTRLVDMGVESFLVASSLVAVSGQRLVRKICGQCRQAIKPEAAVLKQIGLTPGDLIDGVIYEGKGCPACMGTGYRGRVAINELMLITESIRSLIVQNKDSGTIRKVAVKEGMRGLREDGARKVVKGSTTIAEVLRVTQEDLIDE